MKNLGSLIGGIFVFALVAGFILWMVGYTPVVF